MYTSWAPHVCRINLSQPNTYLTTQYWFPVLRDPHNMVLYVIYCMGTLSGILIANFITITIVVLKTACLKGRGFRPYLQTIKTP